MNSIPFIRPEQTVNPLVVDFCNELKKEVPQLNPHIRIDYGTRVTYATDNSIYQLLPQAVIYPESSKEVSTIFKLASDLKYSTLKFAPRGGGTGTNGQSLTNWIVLDLSRRMNKILEVGYGFIRVQPGVILDQLNDWLRSSGRFFAPNVSTSSRATIGGMFSTDACGQGSRIYGRTSDHTLSVEAVLSDGSIVRFNSEVGEHTLKDYSGLAAKIYQEMFRIRQDKVEEIEQIFPKLNRGLTGYNLKGMIEQGMTAKDSEVSAVNPLAVLSGSEGTLAVITELTLKTTQIPKYKKLFCLEYSGFHEALESAQLLIPLNPSSVETIDEKIMQLVRQDEIWSKLQPFWGKDIDPKTKTINFVEFTGDNYTKFEAAIASFREVMARSVDEKLLKVYETKNNTEMSVFWEFRKRGVGLLGNTKGERKPVAFVEDCAVPPEKLADFVKDFENILLEKGLEYGMFGHVDVGCIHVRPALDILQESDEKLVRELSNRIQALVKSYGGILWGEHGKGFRSEYVPQYFGELYEELRKIKAAFDPLNKLNPGKIASPSDEDLTPIDGVTTKGSFNRNIPINLRQEFETALSCNGNGQCFSYKGTEYMCPSFKATGDRLHSPKGRAGLIREWLRLSSAKGFDTQNGTYTSGRSFFLIRWFRSLLFRSKTDFNQEVKDAMDGCLACKACVTQCPIKVDIPEFKSRFAHYYHKRYSRPIRDYLIGFLEFYAPLLEAFVTPINLIGQSKVGGFFSKWLTGIVNPPKLSPGGWKKKMLNAEVAIPEKLSTLSEEEKKRSVIIIQEYQLLLGTE